MTTVEILRYEARHRTAVVELQRRLWSPSPTLNQSYFQWKFVDNPHAEFGDIFLAASGDRIVGMRGFMGTLWVSPDGAPIAIPLAGDTVVAPDYEGRGIVNRLSAAARHEFGQRGIALILNTSASPAVYLHSIRSGWKALGPYAEMRRRPQPRWLYGLVREIRRLPLLSGPADPFAAEDGTDWTHSDATISLRSAPDPVAFSDLWASARPARYSMVRDASFFRWRFANPFYKYYFLTCSRDDRLTAYLALSVRERKRGPDTRVVDWCSPDPTALQRLIEGFTRRFPGLVARILGNALTVTERKAFAAVGFREIAGRTSTARAATYQAGVLAIPTAGDGKVGSAQAIISGGLELLDFRGIESDGA